MIDIKLPSLGEGVEKGVVITILVKEGDQVSVDQPLIEVETDKVTAEVPSELEGVVQSILVSIGDEISEGFTILKMETKDSDEPEEILKIEEISNAEDKQQTPEHVKPKESLLQKSIIATTLNESSQVAGKKFRASPLARKVAREIGIDIHKVNTTSDSGRISVQNVKDYAKQLIANSNNGTSQASVALPDFSKYGSIKRVAMTGIANATSRNMSQSWSQIPHAWLQEKADITELESMRKLSKEEVKLMGGSLTITILLVKAISKAIEKYPIFNASIDVHNKELIYKDYINIGVAVDTPRGLVVPVIKDVTHKSLTTLSITLTELSIKAREGKLTSEDISGATFTISNLGGIGTTGIFPIVNFPQAAILGVAASDIESKWIDEGFQPRLMMPMTVGFDHRVINGADAARFLQHIKRILETWFLASL